MKIIKYLLLLFVLATFAVSVYVATEKGTYTVVKTKIINSPKATVFNFISDYKNYETWNSFVSKKTSNSTLNLSQTVGADSNIKWISIGGSNLLQTIYYKENDSLVQELNFEGTKTIISWGLKTKNGKTEIRYEVAGELPFFEKVIAITQGGIEKNRNDFHEKNIAQLDRALDFEINTYSITVDGLYYKKGNVFLNQTINSLNSKIYSNTSLMLSEMKLFITKNNLTINGSPFIIINSKNEALATTNFSLCLPIKEEIFTSSESEILCSKKESFFALKTTIKGDYSHIEEGLLKAKEYLKKNNLTENKNSPMHFVFSKRIEQEKRPSKWVTVIYLPVTPKPVKKELKTVVSDTISEKLVIPN